VTSARRVALAALKIWRTEKTFADSILAQELAKPKLSARDRGFALKLFYGVLRNLTLLDFWIDSLRQTRLDAALRDILRLGLYQLLLLKISAHAAVFEAVELAGKRQRPLANAILRAALKARDNLEHNARKQPLSIQFSHPEFLLTRWQHHFGEEAVCELCVWNNRPAPVLARINRLKISSLDFRRAYPGSLILQNRENFVELTGISPKAIASGDFYIQDPSTAMACDLLGPRPGEKILDTCAAPGGKTGLLAEQMGNVGTIVACDRDPARINLLRDNLSRLGVTIASLVKHDWEEKIPGAISSQAPFDRILIDAPCSNTGVMRRRVDVRWRLRPGDFGRMQKRQIAIVEAAVNLLKPGGTLVYSTCSIEPEENEQVAEFISSGSSALQREQQDQLLPFRNHFDGAFAVRFVRTR